MADREKVIREKVIEGLEKAKEFFEARADMAVGKGKMLLFSWVNAQRDAIEMLKAQEPVKPRTDDAWPYPLKVCGVCGTCLFMVGDYKPKYCYECGRAVKWDE